MSMEDFGQFEDTQANNLNFEDGDDAFASAVPSDPFAAAGGMQMSSQQPDDFSSPSRLKHDDYTPEELELIAKAEEANQERKKASYLKQQEEEQQKQ